MPGALVLPGVGHELDVTMDRHEACGTALAVVTAGWGVRSLGLPVSLILRG